MTEDDILYQNGDWWVCRCRGKGKNVWYEVLQNTITHAERRMRIGEGEGPNLGLERAKAECDKRATDPYCEGRWRE